MCERRGPWLPFSERENKWGWGVLSSAQQHRECLQFYQVGLWKCTHQVFRSTLMLYWCAVRKESNILQSGAWIHFLPRPLLNPDSSLLGWFVPTKQNSDPLWSQVDNTNTTWRHSEAKTLSSKHLEHYKWLSTRHFTCEEVNAPGFD